MRRLISAIVLLLVGCGTPQTVFQYKCEVPVFGLAWTEGKLDCNRLSSDILLAREAFVTHGLLTEEEVDQAFAGVPLKLVDREILRQDGEGTVMGQYSVSEGILLPRDATFLVHEMCHHLDALHWNPVSFSHFSWDVNGFDAAQTWYQHRYLSPWHSLYASSPVSESEQ